MKKFRILLIIVFLLGATFLGLRLKKQSEDRKYQAKAIYVYNLTDDKKVYGKNEDERLPMASLTKIMTVRLALRHIRDLSKLAPVDTKAYQEAVANNASMAGFFGGESTTFRDLLYGTMLASGAEACDSLAINVAGSVDDFVRLMNDDARKLKLKNTSYANADGMDNEGNYQSAKDCAMLIKDSLYDGNFRAIFTRKDFLSSPTNNHPEGLYIESTIFKNLKDYQQKGFEILGGKSGTTDKAGLCWATLAEKNGKEYIVVVMGVAYDDINDHGDEHIRETLELLEKIK